MKRSGILPDLLLLAVNTPIEFYLMNSPLISIIIPTFNVEAKIESSLYSVLDNQYPFESSEVLVIDGSSTDGTVDIVRTWTQRDERVHIWSEPDSGIYDGMNKGIARARGQFLYFLGAGDIMRPHVLSELQNQPDLHPLLLLHGQVWHEQSNTAPGAGAGIKAIDLARYNIPHQGAFYGRQIFEIVGLYDQKYPICADYELNWRCWTHRQIEKRFWNRIVADFEVGGASAAGKDGAFVRDWPGHVWRRGGPICWAAFQVSRFISPRQMESLRRFRTLLRRKAILTGSHKRDG